MSFQEVLKKLKTSSEFQLFKKKNKKAFLYSAFFTLRNAFGNLIEETQQLDFFIPPNKVVTFTIEEKIQHKTEQFKPKGEITAINEDIAVDINKLKEIIKKEIKKQKLESFDIDKIIAILQKTRIKDKKQQIWNITCLLTGFKMLRLYVDCFNGKILKSEQASIFDFMGVKK